MRSRIIYNSEGLYVGPAPSSGYQFMNYIGQLNNECVNTGYEINIGLDYHGRGDAFESRFYESYTPDSPVGAVSYSDQIKDVNLNTYTRNYNLIQKLDRVQSYSWDINFQRQNVSQLNKKSTVEDAIIANPVVSFSFSWLINGIRNEHRLGMNVNFPMFQYPFDGEPYYSGNEFFLFSGMSEQDVLDNRGQHERGENWDISKFSGRAFSTYTGASWQQTGLVPFDVNSGEERARRYYIQDNAPVYPFSYRDKRNFYVNIAPEGVDEGTGIYFEENINQPFNECMFNHRSANSNQVLAIGDCQLTSYRCAASIGSFPEASVSYVGNNVSYHNSASGENIPSVWPKDGEAMTGKFSIPESFRSNGVSVLRNGDITLNIESSNIGTKITGINLQSYSFAIELERSELKSLGYQFPIDRPINFPIFMQGQFTAIVNQYDTGSYIDLVRDDKILNLDINVAKPTCDDWLNEQKTGAFYQGIPRSENYNILNYTIKKARITSVGESLSIGQNKSTTVTFSAELDPEDLTKGFFISGVHNTERLFNYLKIDHASGGVGSGDGMFLLTEEGEPIICDWAFV